MKIGVLNNLYEPFRRGGAEKVAAAMISDWRRAGHEVFLITTKPRSAPRPEPNDLKTYYFDSAYYHLGEFPLWYRFFWQGANLFSFGRARRLKKILRAEKPDLVVTHNLMGLGFLGPGVIRRLKIRHEHFLHDIQLLHPSGLIFYGREKIIDSGAARLYQCLTRCLFASPAKVTSPSKWLLEQYKQRGFFKKSELAVAPFKRQPEGQALAKRRAATQSENQSSNPSSNPTGRTFLFVGQMEIHKGIFLLIDAFKKLADPRAKLWLVGNGRQLAAAQAAASGDKRIEFFPWSEETESAKMAASDFLVVPSLCYENSPTIISKAQAIGLPVIASGLGGIPEICLAPDRIIKPETAELAEALRAAVGR